MAIKKEWTIKGTTYLECHHRIKQAIVTDANTIDVILYRYADISTKNANVNNAIDYQLYKDIPYDKGGNQNPHTVAYTFIMNKPEFAGSEIE